MKQTCPQCHKDMPLGVLICQDCMIHVQSGRKIEVDVGEVYDDELEPVEPKLGLLDYVRYIPAAYQGLGKPGVLVWAGILMVVGLALMAGGLVMFTLVPLAGFSTCGLGVLAWAQGGAAMVMGENKLLPELLTDFSGAQWMIFLATVGVPFLALCYTLVYLGEQLQ